MLLQAGDKKSCIDRKNNVIIYFNVQTVIGMHWKGPPGWGL